MFRLSYQQHNFRTLFASWGKIDAANDIYIFKTVGSAVIRCWSGNRWNTSQVVQASIINQIDDNHLNGTLIFNFHKRLILNIQGADHLFTNIESYFNHVFRQNSELWLCQTEPSNWIAYASKSYKEINKKNITHNLGYNPF